MSELRVAVDEGDARASRARGRPPLSRDGTPSEVVSTKMPIDEVDRLYALARQRRTDLSALIRKALRQLLATSEPVDSVADPDEPVSRRGGTWGRQR